MTPPTRAWQLIMTREIMVKLADRTFLLSTVGTVVLIAGVLGLQGWLDGRTSSSTVAAAPSAAAMAGTLADRAPDLDDDVVVRVIAVPDEDAARAAVRAGDADAWLQRLPADGGWVLTSHSQVDEGLAAVTERVVQEETLRANAAAAGTTAAALTAGSTVRTDVLQGGAERADLVAGVSFAFAMLFYFAALMFGMTLASSVVEEKQSRIVEIIATAVPVRQLLAGKVAGNTVIALGQMALYVAVGLVGLSLTSYSPLVAGLAGPVTWFLVFFLAGFIVLACLWAVAGSLAARQEDLQATTGPLTMLTLVVFFAALLLEGRWAVVASFVPPFSAVLMPIRILEGTAPLWQAGLALGLLLATAGVTILLGERLYRRSLLQTGGRVSLRRAWATEV